MIEKGGQLQVDSVVSQTPEWLPEMHEQNKHYQQLTQGQRYQIQALYGNDFSKRKIASTIGVSPSTVSRELRRNMSSDGKYDASIANQLKNKRKNTARKHNKSHERHGTIIAAGLLMGWSPEKISLRMKTETPALAVSHSTLYRWIAADKAAGGCLPTQLPRFGKTRWKGGKRNHAGRSMIPGRVDISQRPRVVEERSRLGDWEGDIIQGKEANLVTLVERASRFTLIGKVANKRADTVAEKMSGLLRRVDTVHTITLDNGGEFALHTQVAATSGAAVYFAKPYASYQRGTNENTNGLIRRHWPKGTNFGKLDESAISDLELQLNLTPRVVLAGLTPLEVYTGRRVALIV